MKKRKKWTRNSNVVRVRIYQPICFWLVAHRHQISRWEREYKYTSFTAECFNTAWSPLLQYITTSNCNGKSLARKTWKSPKWVRDDWKNWKSGSNFCYALLTEILNDSHVFRFYGLTLSVQSGNWFSMWVIEVFLFPDVWLFMFLAWKSSIFLSFLAIGDFFLLAHKSQSMMKMIKESTRNKMHGKFIVYDL